jgi:hypothetical protein
MAENVNCSSYSKDSDKIRSIRHRKKLNMNKSMSINSDVEIYYNTNRPKMRTVSRNLSTVIVIQYACIGTVLECFSKKLNIR